MSKFIYIVQIGDSSHEGYGAGDEGNEDAEDGNGGAADDDVHDEDGNNQQPREWSDKAKLTVYGMLLERTTLGLLKRGVTKEVARLTGMPQRSVQDVWRKGNIYGGMLGVLNRKPKNCGRKRIAIDSESIKAIDKRKRTTIKDLANELNVSATTVWMRLKEKQIRRHKNAIKGTLTDLNKRRRVEWCLSQFEEESLPKQPSFKGMYNVVHIDEKWFYRTKKSLKLYLTEDEEEPERCSQRACCPPQAGYQAQARCLLLAGSLSTNS
ncbi:transposon mariner sub-class [Hordeum vulgare]|nr:transposon mariner sub-class [Hordeum vulgare]